MQIVDSVFIPQFQPFSMEVKAVVSKLFSKMPDWVVTVVLLSNRVCFGEWAVHNFNVHPAFTEKVELCGLVLAAGKEE